MKIIAHISFRLAMLISMSFLLMTSCSDNNFVNTETETEINPPDTIPYIYITGKITNTKGEVLSNITVDYRFNSDIKTVKTDEFGAYEIRQIPEGTERTVIHCYAEGFIPKMDILKIENEVVKRDIVLAGEGEIGEGDPANMSLTDSLVSLSGRLIDANGQGVPDLIVLVLDGGFNFFYYGITDVNGIWSVAIEPQENIAVLAANECEAFEQVQVGISVLDDLDIGDKPTNLSPVTFISVSGFVKDCNTNEGLVFGTVQFSFEGDFDKFSADILDGVYEIDLPVCTNASCVDVRIISYQKQSGIDTMGCLPVMSGDNVLDFEVCNSPNSDDNGGRLTTVINSDSSLYRQVMVEEDISGYQISALDIDSKLGVILTTKNKDLLGKFEIAAIIDLNSTIAPYAAPPQTINYQIDSITTEYMYGNYGGQIVDSSNGEYLPFTGNFKAKIQ